MMARIRRSRGAIAYYVAVAAVAVVLAWVIVTVDGLRASSDLRQEALDVLVTDVDVLREQVMSTGEEPAAPPPEERIEDIDESIQVGPRGPRGERGPAPTVAQIRAAVSSVLASTPSLTEPQIVAAVTSYLQENPPADGADGDDGERGRPPTEQEIAVAVAAYCSDGACRGSEGPQGPTGPTPTDTQIAAAIATYCDARGECRGAPGEDGRGIASIDCAEDTDDWTVTYTDGTTETVEGPCRVTLPPDPSPTEETS